MLGVGITENVILNNANLDDKNWLTLQFKEVTDKPFNAFAALGAENEVIDTPVETMDIKLFNPKVPKAISNAGVTRTEEQIQKLITADINQTKGVLLHILKGYLTKDEIKFDMYRGTGIDENNYAARLKEQSVLDLIHKNLCMDFIGLVKPFLGLEDHKFRLLLLRTSKDKHFATFRSRFLDENPMWEPMSIPKEASKVKFSPFEEREGLNDGTPASRGTADKPGDAPAQEVTASSVFGG